MKLFSLKNNHSEYLAANKAKSGFFSLKTGEAYASACVVNVGFELGPEHLIEYGASSGTALSQSNAAYTLSYAQHLKDGVSVIHIPNNLSGPPFQVKKSP